MPEIDLDALEARIEGSYDLCHINAREVTDVIARLREAETVIEAIDAIEPMWPRGMYGCPQDMVGRNQIRAVLARYKTTKTEGSEP